jgi:hypothetical protein
MMRGDMAGIRARLSRRHNHIALQIDARQRRNQSGTFSGTFLGVGSRYIPFDPLAFRGGDHSGNVTKMLKAFVYWAFLGERIGDPSRIRTCNPRSRNPLLYPVELWDRRELHSIAKLHSIANMKNPLPRQARFRTIFPDQATKPERRTIAFGPPLTQCCAAI